jgi:hypothetical protein
MEKKNESVFKTLNAINVNEHVEQKNGLTYLSWAWAWAKVKELYPDATYTVYENKDGLNYHTDGETAWVKTGVTINGLEHVEMLPVMDNRNVSIHLKDFTYTVTTKNGKSYEVTVPALTSFDVNKAIQRSLTKACARHGLGLYIYAGEDLPEEVKKEAEEKKQKEAEELLVQACNEMRVVKSVEELNAVWAKYPQFHAKGNNFYNITAEVNQNLRK